MTLSSSNRNYCDFGCSPSEISKQGNRGYLPATYLHSTIALGRICEASIKLTQDYLAQIYGLRAEVDKGDVKVEDLAEKDYCGTG